MASEIEGMDSALRTFKRLERAGQARVMRRALNAALTPVLKATRRAAPKGDEPHKTYNGRTVAPGFMSRNIRKSTKISRDKRRVFGSVKPAPEAWYGSMKEFGGKRRKYPKDPWFYQAADTAEDASADAYFEKLQASIEAEWNKS